MNIGQILTEKIKRKYPIITLCGSTKFKEEFELIRKQLTLENNIVLGPEIFGHSGDKISEEQKNNLDKLHLAKIDLSDAIFVINKNNYVGDSTKKEIEYAKKHNKKIFYYIDY